MTPFMRLANHIAVLGLGFAPIAVAQNVGSMPAKITAVASQMQTAYSPPTKEQLRRVFADETQGGAKLEWYSDPARMDASKRAFMASLVEDCQKLHIPVPQVFVLAPKFIQGLPDPHFTMGLSESGIDPEFGPYVAFRSDLLDPAKSNNLFAPQHALAVRAHELGHIRNKFVGLNFATPWAEELAANRVSVALGYGEALGRAIKIEDGIERKAFETFLASFYPGKTYDEALKAQISFNPHPPIGVQLTDIETMRASGKDSVAALQDVTLALADNNQKHFAVPSAVTVKLVTAGAPNSSTLPKPVDIKSLFEHKQ